MTQLPSLEVTIQLLHEKAQMPAKAHPTDACFDLRAAEGAVLADGCTALVGLGFAMQLCEGWEARIRGRSGLASRGVVAHHGTIDHLYRKEVKVILHNFSGEEFRIEQGDRVAQLTFAPVFPAALQQGEIELTQRGGFGSTGVK